MAEGNRTPSPEAEAPTPVRPAGDGTEAEALAVGESGVPPAQVPAGRGNAEARDVAMEEQAGPGETAVPAAVSVPAVPAAGAVPVVAADGVHRRTGCAYVSVRSGGADRAARLCSPERERGWQPWDERAADRASVLSGAASVACRECSAAPAVGAAVAGADGLRVRRTGAHAAQRRRLGTGFGEWECAGSATDCRAGGECAYGECWNSDWRRG